MSQLRAAMSDSRSHAHARKTSENLSKPVQGDQETSRNNAAKTRGRPFAPGNAGRPRGARHKTSLAIEALLEGQHKALTQKAISMALAGDITALRLCLERLAPAKRDAPIRITLPQLSSAGDAVAASSSIIAAVSAGELTPSEGGALMTILGAHLKFVETLDLEVRIQQLERQAERQ